MVPDRRHGRHQRVALAAVGCLVGLWSWEVGAQPANRPPVAKPGKAVKAKPDGQAERNQQPASRPTWPADIEAAEQASRAKCGTSEECRAEQREYSDLRAQWQAAEAAKGQETFARYQAYIAAGATILAGIGTIFLIWTFRETKRSADAAAAAAQAAVEANRLSQETFAADQRPWVSVEGCQPSTDLQWDSSQFYIQLNIAMKNVGKSPALKTEVWIKLTTERDWHELEQQQVAFADEIRGNIKSFSIVVFPDQVRNFSAVGGIFTKYIQSQFADKDMIEGPFDMYVLGCVDYHSTPTKRTHQTGFIYMIGNGF